MRAIVLILLLLLAGGWLICRMQPAAVPPSPAVAEPQWRRTAVGWQKRETWERAFRTEKPYEPALHPLNVAVLLALGSTLGLLAFPAKAVVSEQWPVNSGQ